MTHLYSSAEIPKAVLTVAVLAMLAAMGFGQEFPVRFPPLDEPSPVFALAGASGPLMGRNAAAPANAYPAAVAGWHGAPGSFAAPPYPSTGYPQAASSVSPPAYYYPPPGYPPPGYPPPGYPPNYPPPNYPPPSFVENRWPPYPDTAQRESGEALPPVGEEVEPWVRPTIRIFEPKARVFFDTGWEAPGKLDIFHDGSLAPSINFLEIGWQHHWAEPFPGYRLGREEWRWGPVLGFGISSLAGDSGDGTQKSSGAPVLMMSAGLQFDFPFVKGNSRFAPSAGLEVGYALGVSSDESLDYIADGAVYVGVSIHVWPD